MSVRSLVADDEPDIRDFVGFVLERAGHDVTVAGDGAEVLAHTSEVDFDLVVLDHHMPKMTGLAVAEFERLREASGKFTLCVFAVPA